MHYTLEIKKILPQNVLFQWIEIGQEWVRFFKEIQSSKGIRRISLKTDTGDLCRKSLQAG